MVLLNFGFSFGQSAHPTNAAFRVNVILPGAQDFQTKKVMLNFQPDRMVLRGAKNEVSVESINYSEISSAQYNHSAEQRKLTPATALAGNFFSLALGNKRVEHHWLTVEASGIRTTLDLDNNNYKAVIAAFEARAGKRVSGWQFASAANNE
jgi:hypothetical protein